MVGYACASGYEKIVIQPHHNCEVREAHQMMDHQRWCGDQQRTAAGTNALDLSHWLLQLQAPGPCAVVMTVAAARHANHHRNRCPVYGHVASVVDPSHPLAGARPLQSRELVNTAGRDSLECQGGILVGNEQTIYGVWHRHAGVLRRAYLLVEGSLQLVVGLAQQVLPPASAHRLEWRGHPEGQRRRLEPITNLRVVSCWGSLMDYPGVGCRVVAMKLQYISGNPEGVALGAKGVDPPPRQVRALHEAPQMLLPAFHAESQ